ncbi:hypothetical protein CRM22_003265 [Opisthorchis felineus]|uniref:C2H2-type domain-containing protein n=1 Tax=Opisthorchis felineus TaxID=147828 RepID=A0A4S2M227_OPIFE|nr:hypothetical protein CRM22_003265 [Opisthorchis felineus]
MLSSPLFSESAYASSERSVNETQDVEQPQDSTEQSEVADNSMYSKRLDNMYKCPECDKSFFYLSKALEHQKSHSDDRDVYCGLCTCSFKHKRSLRRHVSKTHANEVHYPPSKSTNNQVQESEQIGNPCRECDRKFTSRNILQGHQEPIHGKVGRYMCDECGKLLSHKRHLIRHVKEVHRRDHQKRCEQCDKKFSRPYMLRQHIEYAHAVDQGEN